MATLIAISKQLVSDESHNDDGFSDRLSHQYTTTMLVLFAIVVSTKQYVGDPINCWAPVHFTDNHVDYTNSFCWVRSTYYLPYEEEVPKEEDESKRDTVIYYQWMPLILMAQALLFYLPCLVWRSMSDKSGLDVNSVTQMTKKIAVFQIEEDILDKIYQKTVIQIHRYLSSCENEPKTTCTISIKHLFSRACCLLCGRQRGNSILSLYLFTKLLYLINAFVQLFVLNALLDTEYHIFGIRALQALAQQHDWSVTQMFPRVTMCDMKVRRLGNVHRYTVQCVLPVNLFNEKIYLFLWFWLVFVIAVTFTSLVKWLMRAVIRIDRHRYIKRHLNLSGDFKTGQNDIKHQVIQFVEKYLKQDGVFLLHLVEQSTNTLTALELTSALWKNYRADGKTTLRNVENAD